MEEQDGLKNDVITLGNAFVEDVQVRVGEVDIHYLTGLKKFFYNLFGRYKQHRTNNLCHSKACFTTTYLLFPEITSSMQVAGSRHMHVQPTAIARRRAGISKGSKLA